MRIGDGVRGVRAFFHFLVHPSARDDPVAASRHQSFIASRAIGGTLALVAFPVYLATVNAPAALTGLAFVWLLSPLAIAAYLSRTGALRSAYLISAANLAGLATFAAGLTGGVSSFLIVWMLVVPLEAALSADRRIVITSIAITGVALLGLALAGWQGLLPVPRMAGHDPAVLAMLGTVSALVYGGGLALSIQAVQVESQRVVAEGAERYRLLAENTTDLISRHAANGEVLFASPAASWIVGTDAAELAGRGLLERIHVADRPAYLTAYSRCAAYVEPVSVEFRLRRGPGRASSANAEYIWLETRCRPLAAGDGADVREIVAVSRDVTAHKRQEAELVKARDAAESANRAKTQFLASMSHELRTPLNAVIGFSEILTRELFGTLGEARYREYARLIHDSGEHLLGVVNEILDMSKIEAGKFTIVPEPFKPAGPVKSVCEIMRHGAEKKSIRLIEDVDRDLPEIVADVRACKQMLLNLVSNAVKFTPEGGCVRVSARRQDEHILFMVADTGIGIAKADLPKLGTPFVQAESSYSRSFDGAGLGLSVVKGLARLHGGTVEIASEVGLGTTVTVMLPIEAGKAAHAEADAVDPPCGTEAAVRIAVGV